MAHVTPRHPRRRFLIRALATGAFAALHLLRAQAAPRRHRLGVFVYLEDKDP